MIGSGVRHCLSARLYTYTQAGTEKKRPGAATNLKKLESRAQSAQIGGSVAVVNTVPFRPARIPAGRQGPKQGRPSAPGSGEAAVGHWH
jgi:hypothetical protein